MSIIRYGMAAAWLAGAAAMAGATVPDFRLPPGGSTPDSSAPAPQGPVAPDVPESQRVGRPSAPPSPTPAPTVTVQPPPPPVVVPSSQATQAPRVAAPRPQPSNPATAAQAPAPQDVTPAPTASPIAPPLIDAPAPPAVAPQRAVDTRPEEGGVTLLGWLAGALALAAGGAWLVLRRRSRVGRPQQASVVSPRAAPAPASASPPPAARPVPAPPPMPAPVAPGGLRLNFTPARLSLSLMNATLAWQLELVNDGPAPLAGLSVRADLIGAHASLPREQQLGGPAPAAGELLRVPALPPGASHRAQGELRLPLAAVAPIRQGERLLFAPLVRLAVIEDGQAAVAHTWLVGLPGRSDGAQNGQVQPIRFDLGPRNYGELAARALG